MVKKVLFLGRIFEIEILMDLHVMKTPESKNQIFSIWSVCMCVSVSVISITQKLVTAETSNLVFYICITYRCYLKLFYEDRTKSLCTGAHKRILMHYGLWTEFLVIEFLLI